MSLWAAFSFGRDENLLTVARKGFNFSDGENNERLSQPASLGSFSAVRLDSRSNVLKGFATDVLPICKDYGINSLTGVRFEGTRQGDGGLGFSS